LNAASMKNVKLNSIIYLESLVSYVNA
jgi:hypothetical protein